MIRGPVLPQVRDRLWALVATRLDAVERGLTLVLEGVDCSGGQLGLVDGLARDAGGAPVLVVLAVEGDVLLPARVLSACEFLERLGSSLAAAIPEANLNTGASGRVLVVGTEASAAGLEQLRRLPSESLHVCLLEPFRVAGTERFAVRWLARHGAASAASSSAVSGPAGSSPPFVVPVERQQVWSALQRICQCIDPSVRVDGDRYWRRITWQGRLLGEVVSTDGELVATLADGSRRSLTTDRDLREFGDHLLRRHAELAAPVTRSADARDPVGQAPGSVRSASRQGGAESLRSTLTAARVSPEEYSALGGPARMAGGEAEGAAVADDVARIVAAQESPWASSRARTD